ncbi:hypothetical protein BC835DRAFT_550930 [Cytidiella melzeri]|nr:hypothetical protein BC835DRAFT_550930 [Cytidiella melzeri]
MQGIRESQFLTNLRRRSSSMEMSIALETVLSEFGDTEESCRQCSGEHPYIAARHGTTAKWSYASSCRCEVAGLGSGRSTADIDVDTKCKNAPGEERVAAWQLKLGFRGLASVSAYIRLGPKPLGAISMKVLVRSRLLNLRGSATRQFGGARQRRTRRRRWRRGSRRSWHRRRWKNLSKMREDEAAWFM